MGMYIWCLSYNECTIDVLYNEIRINIKWEYESDR